MGADVVIVGAGSSGATLAARLSEDHSRSVILLESGPSYRSSETPPIIRRRWPLSVVRDDSPYQWGQARVRLVPDQPEQPYAQGRGTGGGSAINALAAIRGTPQDYDGWAAAGCRGWSWPEVLPAFRRLERDVQFGDREHHGADGPIPIFRPPVDSWGAVAIALFDAAQGIGFPDAPDHNDPVSSGISPLAFNVDDGVRVSTNDAYLEPARSRPNLDIRGSTDVSRVLIEGGRATGVETLDGEVVGADEIVLCAGAIQSPALLLRSGIGDPDQLRMLGIDAHADLRGVGGNLSDHPLANFILAVRPGARTGDYPLACYLRCAVGDDDGPNNTVITGYELPASPGARLLAHMWAKAAVVHSRGRVTVRSDDPTTYPVVEFNMLSDRRDLVRLREATRLIAKLLTQPAFDAHIERAYRVVGGPFIRGSASLEPLDPSASDADIEAWLRSACGTIWHPAGTCAMGSTTSDDTVVTPDCRVRGIDGLRVVDASVMPSLPRANPNLTCIMLAEHISATW